MRTLAGQIVTPQGIQTGRIRFDQHIQLIEADQSMLGGHWILPGFIDLHVHGGGGADCMDGADAVRQMAAFHARHGATSLLPTTMTDDPKNITKAFAGIADTMQQQPSPINAAEILGVHLEGPFINPDALGAQPPFAIPPDPALAAAWHKIAPIKIATVAPEIDEACLLLNYFLSIGTRVQIGHTSASSAQSDAALEQGYTGITHLFNAMTGLHHRKPGVVGSSLARADFAEIILDNYHVAPTAIELALRAIPNLYAITDAGAAAGMPDGQYHLGNHKVRKIGDRVLLEDDRTIAGSALTMDQAFRNWLALDLSVEDAAMRCSTYQANYLELVDRGQIAHGFRADFVVMDAGFDVVEVYIQGEPILGAD